MAFAKTDAGHYLLRHQFTLPGESPGCTWPSSRRRTRLQVLLVDTGGVGKRFSNHRRQDVTTAAELAAWLRDLFADAEVESGVITRSPGLSFHQVVLDELQEYVLFRIQPPGGTRLQVGVTTRALEQLPRDRLQLGMRRAIRSATDQAVDVGARFIVTAADLIVREEHRPQ